MNTHHRSNSLEINIGNDNGTNELEEFLIQQRDKDNNNALTGFLSKVGNNVKKYVPKRIGGTGSIEDDIAVRFGMFSGLSSSGSTAPSEEKSCISRLMCCGYTMSRKERIVGFFLLLGMGITFFVLSSLYIPLLLLKARKFSILFTFGSVFTFASLSVLWGFTAFLRHLVTSERLPFTSLYFGSLFATLFFAIHLQSTILTVAGITVQILSLLSFIISYLPGGITGLTYLTKFISSSFSRTLPI